MFRYPWNVRILKRCSDEARISDGNSATGTNRGDEASKLCSSNRILVYHLVSRGITKPAQYGFTRDSRLKEQGRRR
ncbi:hypothetical protein PoB_005961000 [Plakobranchus ocellatus]|uniref:Uncharacterized protein n=1 Tax=Plakobranchus ocellatus TaxID=259542 RepID=A0AAV4CMK0_9GAST|nr:hypothetical protein PoB_005961000 [Plakobranchus ocellatus]